MYLLLAKIKKWDGAIMKINKCLSEVLALFMALIMLTGCTATKEVISAENFINKVEGESYTVVDISDQYTEEDSVIKVLIAEGTDYNIEYYLLGTHDDAVALFEATVQDVSTGSGSYVSQNGKNYSTFKGTYDEVYYYISQIENTLIYIQADASNKNDVSQITKKLGF